MELMILVFFACDFFEGRERERLCCLGETLLPGGDLNWLGGSSLSLFSCGPY